MQDAEQEDYEEKLKEIQDVCGPIISKVGILFCRDAPGKGCSCAGEEREGRWRGNLSFGLVLTVAGGGERAGQRHGAVGSARMHLAAPAVTSGPLGDSQLALPPAHTYTPPALPPRQVYAASGGAGGGDEEDLGDHDEL